MAKLPDERGARVDSGRRLEVVELLRRARRPTSIAEMAETLGIHPNTVRFHLSDLVERGQVEAAPLVRGVPGRPAARFVAVRRMDPDGPRQYRLLAQLLVHSLAAAPDAAERAVAAGREWGRRQPAPPAGRSGRPGRSAIRRLVALLSELGFAPQHRTAEPGERVELHRCPFLELAEGTPEVVCGVHLGLMQGALEHWNAPVTVDRLDPFVEPDVCVAHLAAVGS